MNAGAREGGGDGAMGEDGRHGAAIFGRGENIRERFDALRGFGAGALDEFAGSLFAAQHFFHGGGAIGFGADARHAERDVFDFSIFGGDDAGSRSHRSESRSGLVEFAIGSAFAGALSGHTNFGKNVARADLRRKQIHEKFRGGNGALAGGGLDDEFRVESENGRGIIGGGVGMSEASADGSAIADLHVANLRSSFGQKRAFFAEKLGGGDLRMSGESADGDVVSVFADVIEAAEMADVDDVTRRSEAELHQRKQAVAAGEDFGFVTVAPQEAQRLVERFGSLIFER